MSGQPRVATLVIPRRKPPDLPGVLKHVITLDTTLLVFDLQQFPDAEEFLFYPLNDHCIARIYAVKGMATDERPIDLECSGLPMNIENAIGIFVKYHSSVVIKRLNPSPLRTLIIHIRYLETGEACMGYINTVLNGPTRLDQPTYTTREYLLDLHRILMEKLRSLSLMDRRFTELQERLTAQERLLDDLRQNLSNQKQYTQELKRSLSFRIGWMITAPLRFLYNRMVLRIPAR